MRTWLVNWNPAKYPWDDYLNGYNTLRGELAQQGWVYYKWTVGNTKSIHVGDRIFMLKQGAQPRGIVASGWAASDVLTGPHYDRNVRKQVRRIYIKFDRILDVDTGEHLPLDVLKIAAPNYNWTPMSSGQSMPDNVSTVVEKLWAEFEVKS